MVLKILDVLFICFIVLSIIDYWQFFDKWKR